MIKNDSALTIRKSSSRSFSDVLSIYKKLAKFYSYNFFLKGWGFSLVFFYLVTIISPLFSLLITGKEYLVYLSEFKNRIVGILLDREPLGNFPKLFISCSYFLAFAFHDFFFLFILLPIMRKQGLYFLERNSDKEVSVQEISVLHYVKKIKPHDILLFELILSMAVQLLHFIVAWTLAFLILVFSGSWEKTYLIFVRLFITSLFYSFEYYILFSSEERIIESLIIYVSSYAEFFIFACGFPWWTWLLRVVVIVSSLVRSSFCNLSRLRKLHG